MIQVLQRKNIEYDDELRDIIGQDCYIDGRLDLDLIEVINFSDSYKFIEKKYLDVDKRNMG